MYLFNKLITNVSDTCYLISTAEKSKYFLRTQLEVWLDEIIVKVCVLVPGKEGKRSKITFCLKALSVTELKQSQNYSVQVKHFPWR